MSIPPSWDTASPLGPAAFTIAAPPQLEINPQTRIGVTSFTVTNLTGRPLRARLLPRGLQGADSSWVTVQQSEVPMGVGATLSIPVTVTVPPGAPGGNFMARLDVVPEDDTEAEVTGPVVAFTVPAAAAPKKRNWILPLIIGIVVLLLLIGTGVFLVVRKNSQGKGQPSQSPSTGTSQPSGKGWSDWEDLGGSITSGPTAASWAQNRLDVFAQGAGGVMLHQAFDGTNWAPVDNLGPQIVGAPGATSWGPNRIDAFVRGTDNRLWQKAWVGQWVGYFPIGDPLPMTSSPTVCAWGVNRLDIFMKGPDDALYHKWWDGSNWSGYERLGGNMEGQPAAVCRGPNLIDVFYRGRNNHLFQKSFDGQKWGPFVDLGAVDSDVAASTWGPQRIDLFREGNDNALLHKSWNGTKWTDWETIGDQVDDIPAAVSWGPNRIDVFARGTNNQLLHKTFTG